MSICLRNSVTAPLLVTFALGLSGPANAAPQDKAAKALANDAIMGDYLGMNFDAAIEKLQKGIALCAQDQCSKKVLAEMHRDLGVVLIAGKQQADQGKAEFATAMRTDPTVVLDEDLSTDEVKAAWEEVKAGGGAAGGEEAAEEVPTEEEAPAGIAEVVDSPAAAPTTPPANVPTSGNLYHTPPNEQVVLTPLPLYLELQGEAKPDEVIVKYMSPNGREWGTAPMPSLGMGYGVEIDCAMVGSVPGVFKYYIQVLKRGQVGAYAGTQEIPYEIPIKNALDGEPPSLPDKAPPEQCEEEISPWSGEGEPCESKADCAEGLVCQANDMEEMVCQETGAGGKKKSGAKNLAFAGFQLDMLVFSKEDRICSGNNDWQCFFAGDREYTGIPQEGAQYGNQIDGGFGMGTMRVVVGYERLVWKGLAVGGRLGFAFGGGPQGQGPSASKFMPFHAEGRAAYYFLQKGIVRPYALLSGGLAQVDGKITVEIVPGPQDPYPPTPVSLFAWKKTGTGFFTAGVGSAFLFSAGGVEVGPFLEGKAGMMLGTSSLAVFGQGGLALGFF